MRARKSKPVLKVKARVSANEPFSRYVAPILRATLFGSPLIHFRLRRLADLKPGQKVLELAAGPVPYHKIWQNKLGRNGELVVSDYSDWITAKNRALSKVSVFRKPQVSHKSIDLNKIEGYTNYFDRIIVVSPFGFGTLKGVERALRPGGKALLFIYMDPATPKSKVQEFLNVKDTSLEIEKQGWHDTILLDHHCYILLRKPEK
ncbi:MAG: hypothetical protein WCW13_02340 [archaeon]|jgi:hypothetical protein